MVSDWPGSHRRVWVPGRLLAAPDDSVGWEDRFPIAPRRRMPMLPAGHFRERAILSSEFFDLRATHNPHRWYLPVTDDVVVGHRVQAFLFGGAGMAAAVRAMERT